jgi:Bacterial aa3 type cytochrome c oxidase subunit IV
MAKKPAAAKAHDETPPAMDYPQHEATWNNFMLLTKWTIVALLIIVVALYCFIEAGQPVLGTLLLLILPVGAVGLAITRSRSSS